MRRSLCTIDQMRGSGLNFGTHWMQSSSSVLSNTGLTAVLLLKGLFRCTFHTHLFFWPAVVQGIGLPLLNAAIFEWILFGKLLF